MVDFKAVERDLTDFRLGLVENQQKLDKAHYDELTKTVTKLSTDVAIVSSDLNKVLTFSKMILGGIALAFITALWKVITKADLGA
jgi:hypothetical protein